MKTTDGAPLGVIYSMKTTTMPQWAMEMMAYFSMSISSAKDEIIDTLSQTRNTPTPNPRGPKNTRFMSMQRTAVRMYVEVECHRPITSVTTADCLHVWNRDENRDEWNKRALKNDSRRGYPNPEHLRAGVIYWFVTVPRTKKSAF